ncbi:MAG: HemK/PrmC family methyltransferase, partial [Myxococcota bacterium]
MNLQDAVLALRQAGIPSPRLDAELLLAHVLRQHRAELYARADIPLSDGCSKHFAMLARRRVAGEPLAYLVGYKEFYGHRFVVNPHVLVPRPETELLVEQALRVLPQDAPGTVIDVCAGSGCVGISIALARPLARVWATDLSEEALKVARRNAANLGVSARIEFVQGDLLEPLTHAGGSGADSRENFLHLDVPTPFVVPAKGCFQVGAGTWGPRKVFARSAKLCGAKAKAGPADPR